jgi:hypothetical protein
MQDAEKLIRRYCDQNPFVHESTYTVLYIQAFPSMERLPMVRKDDH